jgi:anti-sigma regulatory factor (Ser/Thr protein kinase)
VHRDFPAESRSVGAAREFVAAAIVRLVPDAKNGDDAELIVSELVTNAVRAGARRVRVEVRPHGEQVRIGVSDDAGGWPVPQRPSPEAVSGRGLLLVSAVSDRWGVETVPLGKQVWAALRVSASLAG